MPEESRNVQGLISSDPRAPLQLKFWINIWTNGSTLKAYEWPAGQQCGEGLPPITAQQVQEASLRFPETMSGSPDGWHPRHLALFSGKGRQEAANILNCMEDTGQLPFQIEIVLMVLLAKPQGGYRPIAILPALYRLWMKIRRPHCEAWEKKGHRPLPWRMARSWETRSGDPPSRKRLRLEMMSRRLPCCGT